MNGGGDGGNGGAAPVLPQELPPPPGPSVAPPQVPQEPTNGRWYMVPRVGCKYL